MDRGGRGRAENLLELCSTVTTLILEDRHLRLPESNIAKPDRIFNPVRASLDYFAAAPASSTIFAKFPWQCTCP